MNQVNSHFPSNHQRNLLLLAILVAVIVLFLIVLFPKGTASKSENSAENLAACFKTQKVVMYGNDTCSECQNQKQIFGSAFSKISYVNCDFNQDLCAKNGVTAFPTWISGEKKLVGLKSLPELAEWSSCPTN